MRIRLVGMENSPNVDENFAFQKLQYQKALADDIDLLVFPEASLTGYTSSAKAFISSSDATNLLGSAAKGPCFWVTGALVQEGDFIYDAAYVLREGKMDAYYKTHLGKREAFCPGENLKIFHFKNKLSFGLALCYELHFPKLFQAYAKAGAHLFLVPFSSPMAAEKRLALWQKLAPARAYDNRSFIFLINHADSNGRCAYAGYDRNGDVLAKGTMAPLEYKDFSVPWDAFDPASLRSQPASAFFLDYENQQIFNRRLIHVQ